MPSSTTQTGTTACDRRKSLASAGIEHCSSFGEAPGVDRYFINGAREIRYWDARTGGCEGTEVHPEGDPNDIDPIALLTAAGLL